MASSVRASSRVSNLTKLCLLIITVVGLLSYTVTLATHSENQLHISSANLKLNMCALPEGLQIYNSIDYSCLLEDLKFSASPLVIDPEHLPEGLVLD